MNMMRLLRQLTVISTAFLSTGLCAQSASATAPLAQPYDVLPVTSPGKVVWVHGKQWRDLEGLVRFTDQLREKKELPFLFVTSETDEGVALAKTRLKANLATRFSDVTEDLAAVFDRIQPKAIIIVEDEFPLNLILLAHCHKVPLYLVNAQFTDKTAERLALNPSVYRPFYQLFDTIYVQSDSDRSKMVKAGVSGAKVVVLGNIKVYNALPRRELAKQLDDPLCSHHGKVNKVLLVGSVYRDEIDMHLANFTTHKPNHPNLKMIIAPRHMDWAKELVEKVKAQGYTYFVWDDQAKIPLPHASGAENVRHLLESYDIVMVCMVGYLFDITSLADIYYVGGTFNNVGGHNVIDPAVWAKAIVIGPQCKNTQDIVEELEHSHAIIKVASDQELWLKIGQLLAHPETSESYGGHAYKWVATQESRVDNQIHKLLKTVRHDLSRSYCEKLR